MFFHIFKNRFKCLIRNKQFIIWLCLFPIFLATMFKVAIPNSKDVDKFNPINIAVVNNDEYTNDSQFKEALKSVSNLDGNKPVNNLFNVKVVDKTQADELLKNSDIYGYIILDNGPKVYIKDSNANSSDRLILSGFVDSYMQTTDMYKNIIANNPYAMQNLMNSSIQDNSYIKEVMANKDAPNNSYSYFYALIAMLCLYGGFLGMNEITNIQADQSPQGSRLNLAPVSKLKMFGASILASIIVQIMIVAIILVFLNFVLGVSLGSNLLYIVLISIIGSIFGVVYGALISVIIKGNSILKTSVFMSLTMIFSFFAGLMWSDIKYIIKLNAPILSYLNPASLISDSFYTLYYYDTYSKYFINISLLIIYSILAYLILVFIVRRRKYASL